MKKIKNFAQGARYFSQNEAESVLDIRPFLFLSGFSVLSTQTEHINTENPAAAQEPVRLTLKWFNGTKGFGFVVPDDGSYDAFLHVTTLQEAGVHHIGEGAVLMCTVTHGDKGANVDRVTEIIDQGTVNMMPPTETADGTVTMGGLVKWFKPEKGFGFIIPDDGMKDVFIHQSLLERIGVEELRTGQRVRVTLKDVEKGREAVNLEIIDAPEERAEIEQQAPQDDNNERLLKA